MVMTVEPFRIASVEPTILVKLHAHDVFEAALQSRMKQDRSQTIPTKVPNDSRLFLLQLRRHSGRRERRRKIQMQPRVNRLLTSNPRGSLGILHENHCACRRNSSTSNTSKDH